VGALDLVSHWPAENVAAAVVEPTGVTATVGRSGDRFRIASLSKVIAAWAALVAVEEGSIGLDAPLPRVAVPPGCSLRHLLAHASGLPFEGDTPIAALGERRIYSNTGIERAADAVAVATEMPFVDYVAEAVLAPLGMHDTAVIGSPAHGVRSTAADLARFVGEMLRPRLLHADTVAEAMSVQFPDLDGIVPGVGRFTPCPWGLGMEIHGRKDPHWMGRNNSPSTVGHFGGAGTMMWVDPVADIGLLALTDLPFDRWPGSPVMPWRELSDAVLAEFRPDGGQP
jgi:CubicO group peptidase (beta-lactamase class C family)